MEPLPDTLYYSDLIAQAVAVSVFIQIINWSLSYFLTIDNFTGFMNFNTLFLASMFYTNSIYNVASKQLFVTFLGVSWSLRLTHYLVVRILRRGGEDTRMNKMRENPVNLAKFWVIHASWCLIVSLPVTLINTIHLAFEVPPGQMLDNNDLFKNSLSVGEIAGIIIYLYGLVIESLADYTKLEHWEQVRTTSAKSANGPNGPNGANRASGSSGASGSRAVVPFCDRGVWSYSRNPNFGGEIILWFGMAILSSSLLFEAFKIGNESSELKLAVSTTAQYMIALTPFLAPAFTAVVLLFLSGANLHEWKDQKLHGKNEAYVRYRERTSPVWPCPPSVYVVLPDFIKKTAMCEWKYYIRRERKRDGKHL